MANFRFPHFAHLLGTAGIDLEAAGAAGQLKMGLFMTDTTVDTEDAVTSMAGFTTLDECDGANYARVTLTNVTWSKDVANKRSELHSDDVVFTNLGAGSRENQLALIIYDPGGGAANQIPIGRIDTGGFPFQGTGSPNTVKKPAEGWIQI